MARRFIIVGGGGIGGRLARDLAMMLEYRDPGSMLLIVDGDSFEPKNKERQVFGDMGNKAEVVVADVAPNYPSTYIVPIPKWVVGAVSAHDGDPEEETDNKILASALLSEGDVVYAVVDNFAARKLLADTARKLDNVDVFLGGNDDALYCSVYHYRRREGVDITDHPEVLHPEFVNPPDRNPGEMSCAERAKIEGGSQVVATNAAVAAILCGRTQHTIFEANSPVPAAEIFFDLGIGQAAAFDRSADPVSVGLSN